MNSRTPITESIALFLISSLPRDLQSRVLVNQKFQEKVGLNGLLANFSEAGRIRSGDILNAARKVYETQDDVILPNLDGVEITLSLVEGLAVVTRIGDEERKERTTPTELALVSPKTATRLNAIANVRDRCGVTGPDPVKWESLLKDRPPTTGEVFKLQQEISRSVPMWWETTTEVIATGKVSQSDLVPSGLDFYANICGREPKNEDVREYFANVVQVHRSLLLERDLTQGLLNLLPTSLRGDYSISDTICEASDEDVWNSLNTLKDLPDPYSQLGMLEIAVARSKSDIKFTQFAENIIERLCSHSMLGQMGNDTYEVFPAFVDLSYCHIRRLDGAMSIPPYWHWYAAFTHAGLLTRLFDGFEIDVPNLISWMKSDWELGDIISDLLSLRDWPTWRLDFVTQKRIRAEIIGRICELKLAGKTTESSFSSKGLVDNAVEELVNEGVSPFRPGPMEGGARPIDQPGDRVFPQEAIEEMLQQLDANTDDLPWYAMEEASVRLVFPDELLGSITKHVLNAPLPDKAFPERINTLALAGMIAIAQKNRTLADAVCERSMNEFEKCDDAKDQQAINAVFVILLSASAIIEDKEWCDWLNDRLVNLVYLSRNSEQLMGLWELVQLLKSRLPISNWRFGQVEALCSTY